METFEMYPIRCSTCGEPVAAYAPMFKFLINNPDFLQDLEPVPSSDEVGTSLSPLNENTLPEKVFRKLGITEWCTRTALMNPTFFAFNMENRAVIEGLKNIDTAVAEESQIIDVGYTRSFGHCSGVKDEFLGHLNPKTGKLTPAQVIPFRIYREIAPKRVFGRAPTPSSPAKPSPPIGITKPPTKPQSPGLSIIQTRTTGSSTVTIPSSSSRPGPVSIPSVASSSGPSRPSRLSGLSGLTQPRTSSPGMRGSGLSTTSGLTIPGVSTTSGLATTSGLSTTSGLATSSSSPTAGRSSPSTQTAGRRTPVGVRLNRGLGSPQGTITGVIPDFSVDENVSPSEWAEIPSTAGGLEKMKEEPPSIAGIRSGVRRELVVRHPTTSDVFVVPTEVGLSTINESKYPARKIVVGPDHQVIVLPGRTYRAI